MGFVLICAAGCTRVPFEEVARVPTEGVEPTAVRERFAAALPGEFQVINTIVFRYRWHSFSALGYTHVDQVERTFTVVGLNHVGVKLLELTSRDGSVECHFAVDELRQGEKFAHTIAKDIERIYFDRIPTAEAEAGRTKYEVLFREQTPEGTLEYVFAGAERLLVEKRYVEGRRRIWSVRYYEYRRENGKLFPAGIVFRHHRHGYRLIVRLKEVRS